ncbi:MAG TPA: polyhydroxyalkanoate synthesis regulator DNA-binding domain-containing protein [Marmoricola sp.]
MSDGAPRVIKRYANRKLYDTYRGTFTTVGDVAQLVVDGVNVVVRDHDTGIDRTSEVLAKAIGKITKVNPIGLGGDALAGVLRAAAGSSKEHVARSPDDSGGSEDPGASEVEALRRQVAELRAEVASLREARGNGPA